MFQEAQEAISIVVSEKEAPGFDFSALVALVQSLRVLSVPLGSRGLPPGTPDPSISAKIFR